MENTEKYKSLSVPTEKVIRKFYKNDNGDIITIYYKIKFIDTPTFMASSLSNLFKNIAEKVHKTKCKDCGGFLRMKTSKIIWWIINVYLSIKVIHFRLIKNYKSASKKN